MSPLGAAEEAAVMTKTGLLGGTFDPIHIVHLFMGTLAREELGLEKVIFMPAKVPPHKDRGSIAPARHRLAMAELALRDHDLFEVSDLELSREAPSYTIDTVRSLRRGLGPGSELYLIMGSDSLLDLDTWKDYDELLSLVTIAVYPRPGHAADVSRVSKSDNIVMLSADGIGFELSSSAIRRRVSQGKSVRYMVPGPVEEYIAGHRLYRDGGSG